MFWLPVSIVQPYFLLGVYAVMMGWLLLRLLRRGSNVNFYVTFIQYSMWMTLDLSAKAEHPWALQKELL